MKTDVAAGPHAGSRALLLEGSRNFRDLGGYATADGRHVKWGKIFRSGTLSKLTPADFDYLAGLKIRTICDLRSTGERLSQPNRWYEVAKIAYWARDHEVGFGELRKVLAADLPTVEEARAAMIAGYRQLPFEQAPAYREVFARLAADGAPLVVNCSAGKDRAGTAAALVLSALGVPRETVIEDYLLTEKFLDTRKLLGENARKRKSPLAEYLPEIATAVVKADADYLHAALDAVEERHGTLNGYLQDELGVTAQALHHIRQSLLE